MKLPTLDEFICAAQSKKLPSNSYVKVPGFKSAYLRIGPRYIVIAGEGVWYWVLDLASITARKPGKGSFSSLLLWLRENYNDLGLFVENVATDRFAAGLVKKFGFSRDENNMGCFHLIGEKTRRMNPRMAQVTSYPRLAGLL